MAPTAPDPDRRRDEVDDRDIVLGDQAPAGTGTVPGRWQATAFDLLVGAYAVGAVLAAIVAAGVVDGPVRVGAGLLVLWAALVLVEGSIGSSPGKVVAGLVVERADGVGAGLREAALRRPWGAPLLLTVVGTPGVRVAATVVAVAMLVAVGVSTRRAPDGRGWHDRLAGTTVTAGDVPRRRRTVVLLVTVAVVLLAAVVRALAGGLPVA